MKIQGSNGDDTMREFIYDIKHGYQKHDDLARLRRKEDGDGYRYTHNFENRYDSGINQFLQQVDYGIDDVALPQLRGSRPRPI